MKWSRIALLLTPVFLGGWGTIDSRASDVVTVVARPDTTATNNFYVSDRAPLEPSQFISLPIGSIQPEGWLREILQRQRHGLCGQRRHQF